MSFTSRRPSEHEHKTGNDWTRVISVIALVVSLVSGSGAIITAVQQNNLSTDGLELAREQSLRSHLENRAATCMTLSAQYLALSKEMTGTEQGDYLDFAEKAKNVARGVAVCLYKDKQGAELSVCVTENTDDDRLHKVAEKDGTLIPIC